MYQPRLHSSQELALHQVNAEQSYRSREGGTFDFPSSPAFGVGLGASAPGSIARGLASSSSPLPLGSLASISYTPGGSSSTATASIVRPEVRHRPEWASALDDVDPFGLPGEHFLDSPAEGATVPVRYIADDCDRQWLAHRMDEYGASLGGALGRGGKTGMLGSVDAHAESAAAPRCGVQSGQDLGVSLLEDIVTAVELAAYANAEIPLERLNSVDSLYLDSVDASPSIINDVRHYWLRKREALGGHIPCIPALKLTVREDNQHALCHPEILGDCPLPFKWRDWTVSLVNRKRRRGDASDDSRECSPDATAKDSAECNLRFADVCLAMSTATLRRERLRAQHTQLALYELSCLRAVGEPAAVNPEQQSRGDQAVFPSGGSLVPRGVDETVTTFCGDLL